MNTNCENSLPPLQCVLRPVRKNVAQNLKKCYLTSPFMYLFIGKLRHYFWLHNLQFLKHWRAPNNEECAVRRL